MCDLFSFSFKTITKERFKMCSYEPKWLASGEIIIDLSPCSEQPEPLHPRGRDSPEGKPHPNEGFEAEITEGWKNGNVGNLGLLLFKVFYRSWSIPKTSIKSVNHEILCGKRIPPPMPAQDSSTGKTMTLVPVILKQN